LEIVVLDLDQKGGGHGLRDFAELAGTPANEVVTPQACSPTGGRHLVCFGDGRCFRNRHVIPGRSIETKTRGGLVHLPAHQNGRHWLKSLATTPIAVIPFWVPEAQSMGAPGTMRPYAEASGFEAAIVAKAAAEIINAPNREQEQTLHRWCFTIGGLIAGGSVDEGPAVEALTDAAWAMPSYNLRRPWKRNALRDKVKASIAKGKRYPLEVPEEILDDGDWEQKSAQYEATNPFGGDGSEETEATAEAASEQNLNKNKVAAEKELAEYTSKLRSARDQTYRTALAYNAGLRLARLAKAGYLSPERVLAEIDAALASWETDHD
jgi:hypothetical protein